MTLGGARTTDQLGQGRPYTLDELVGDVPRTDLVALALSHEGGEATFEVVSYTFGSPATGGLYRLRGDGWSLFCKVLQHPRHWPLLPTLPPEAQPDFLAGFP